MLLSFTLYKISHKLNIKVVIKVKLENIFESNILLILYIDLKFLYYYLIKLSFAKQK